MGQLALILLPQSKGRFCTCSKQLVGVRKVHRSLRTCIRSRSPFRLFVRPFVLPFCLPLRNKAGIFFKTSALCCACVEVDNVRLSCKSLWNTCWREKIPRCFVDGWCLLDDYRQMGSLILKPSRRSPLTLSLPRGSQWRVKSSGVRQSKIYKCQGH